MDAMRTYLDELYLWNRRINLTAVPREEAEGKHVDEVRTLLHACDPAQGSRCADVGAGGGVPGIPMAILRPDLRVTLVESDLRKCAFLTHVAGLLGLRNVAVECARIDEVARRDGMRESFDLAVSRALAPPPTMCEWTLPLVRTGGRVATLVGDAHRAAADCARASQLLGGDTPRAAEGDVLLIDKRTATPDEYPRRADVPLRKPLL